MSTPLYRALVAAGVDEALATDAVAGLDKRSAEIAQSSAESVTKNEASRVQDQFIRLGDRVTRLEVEIKAEIKELKVELRAEMKELKAEMRAEMKELKTEIGAQMEELKAGLSKMQLGLAEMENRLFTRLMLYQSLLFTIAITIASVL